MLVCHNGLLNREPLKRFREFNSHTFRHINLKGGFMIVQFKDLSEEEKSQLQKQAKERARKEGRELLEDVVCAYRPIKDCKCSCCLDYFEKENKLTRG